MKKEGYKKMKLTV